jgi:hypothetical protein
MATQSTVAYHKVVTGESDPMNMLAFLLKTTDRLVSRVLLNALFFGVLAAAVSLLVAYEGTRQWPPQQLTYVAVALIAGFAAYAAGVSVLLRAALHGLVRATAEAQHVEQVVSSAAPVGAPHVNGDVNAT